MESLPLLNTLEILCMLAAVAYMGIWIGKTFADPSQIHIEANLIVHTMVLAFVLLIAGSCTLLIGILAVESLVFSTSLLISNHLYR